MERRGCGLCPAPAWCQPRRLRECSRPFGKACGPAGWKAPAWDPTQQVDSDGERGGRGDCWAPSHGTSYQLGHLLTSQCPSADAVEPGVPGKDKSLRTGAGTELSRSPVNGHSLLPYFFLVLLRNEVLSLQLNLWPWCQSASWLPWCPASAGLQDRTAGWDSGRPTAT